MRAHHFRLVHVVRALSGTAPFAAYCCTRGILYRPPADNDPDPPYGRRWAEATAGLSPDRLAAIERDLARVDEMASPDAVAHLVEAASGGRLPPDDLPAGAPVALWFRVHRPELFDQVFVHQDVRAIASWRTARAPAGLDPGDMHRRLPAVIAGLRAFFRHQEGVGRYCTAEAFQIAGCRCVVAHLADRPHLVDAFTDHGKQAALRVRPAFRVTFAYDPRDGTVLIQSRLRARDRLLTLVRLFGSTILGVELGDNCLAPAFDLEPLKRTFSPLPDGPDMESVRVKALHLRYPARAGRRLVKLETHAADGPTAVPDLLRAHLSAAGLLDQLDVCYAELQVRLRVDGGSKRYLIRLFPDRCNLDRTPVGERLRACLRRWGLCYAP